MTNAIYSRLRYVVLLLTEARHQIDSNFTANLNNLSKDQYLEMSEQDH